MKHSIILILSLTYPLLGNAKVNRSRLSSFPYVSGDSFRAIADHIFDETSQSLNPQQVKDGDVIFLKTDYLDSFFTKIHPKINHRYLLITHNSDYGAPGSFEQYLNDETLVAWFGMSPTVVNHPKFIPIPIGIANQYWRHGNIDTFNDLLKAKKVNQPKKHLVGINFSVSTNIAERSKAYNYFAKQSFCSDISSPNHATYLLNMALSKFVVCPPGNSLDCHRTWEALLAGTIPIMLHSNLDELLEGLPIVFVNRWEDVTPEFLHNKLQELESTFYSNEKIMFMYWYKKIQSYRNKIIHGEKYHQIRLKELVVHQIASSNEVIV